jgi:hypothetical protein
MDTAKIHVLTLDDNKLSEVLSLAYCSGRTLAFAAALLAADDAHQLALLLEQPKGSN